MSILKGEFEEFLCFLFTPIDLDVDHSVKKKKERNKFIGFRRTGT